MQQLEEVHEEKEQRRNDRKTKWRILFPRSMFPTVGGVKVLRMIEFKITTPGV